MKRQIFTLANQLTFFRLALIPFFALAILNRKYGCGLGLLVAAGLSDLLDGMLARRLQQRTPLGAYLDPIADKLLLSTAFLVLAVEGDVPWTLTVLVLSRDVLILTIAVVVIIGAGYRPFPPSLYGKATTVAQLLTVFAAVLAELGPPAALLRAKDGLLWLTAALTILSGLHYAYRTGRLISELPTKV
jgi:cardiolipin synthase